jgi:hypothetical protein
VKESAFQNKLKNACKDQGAWVFNIWGSIMQKSGVPDLYISHPKFRGWVELKVGTGRPSQSQVNNIHSLQECGDVAFVVIHRKDGFIYYDFLDGKEIYCDSHKDFFADPMTCLKEVWEMWREAVLQDKEY